MQLQRKAVADIARCSGHPPFPISDVNGITDLEMNPNCL